MFEFTLREWVAHLFLKAFPPVECAFWLTLRLHLQRTPKHWVGK